MSFFKTLQSSAGTISIFHSPKVPKLAKLYQLLMQANYKLNEDRQKFMVDLMENTMPTYDQYTSIALGCLKDTYSKHALKNCFPFVAGTNSESDKLGKNRTTVTAPAQLGRLLENGMKLFSAGEYAMIHEAFDSVAEAHLTEYDTTQIFLPPLVVDWDLNLIANDEEGLLNILSHYRQ